MLLIRVGIPRRGVHGALARKRLAIFLVMIKRRVLTAIRTTRGVEK